ncbi:mucin-17-like [Ranitomeya imitator]|uniref:mucin-17-like n=1 Tax=Ranitomeya imitator TaxID=111125 RepID=UPI0037E7B94D
MLDQNDIFEFQTADYDDVGKKIKDEVNAFNVKVSWYQDEQILEAGSGGIIVYHVVLLDIENTLDSNLSMNYDRILKDVRTLLDLKAGNCDMEDSSQFCFTKEDIIVENTTLLTDLERCQRLIPDGFTDFYTSVLTPVGPICLSHCEPTSKEYYDCNKGKCEIQKVTGPACFCSDTNTYIYTGPRCTGPILKAGVYGGVGAALGILVLIVAVVGFFLCRKRNKKEKDTLINDKDKWYEDTEDEWSIQKGFSKEYGDSKDRGTDGQYHDVTNTTPVMQPNKEAFKPNLESVDTNIEIKIQRPVVSYT